MHSIISVYAQKNIKHDRIVQFEQKAQQNLFMTF